MRQWSDEERISKDQPRESRAQRAENPASKVIVRELVTDALRSSLRVDQADVSTKGDAVLRGI
jgi:hypothetical protein